jgi:hypothetical protein
LYGSSLKRRKHKNAWVKKGIDSKYIGIDSKDMADSKDKAIDSQDIGADAKIYEMKIKLRGSIIKIW